MQAVLNALTGTALVFDGQRASLLHVDAEPETAAAHVGALPRVIGEGRNIDVVSVAGVEDALEILKREHLREECLDIALILLDSELSDSTRREAAEVLNQMLLDWDVRSWLEGILYGAPLPDSVDVERALQIASSEHTQVAVQMLSRLAGLQDVIRRVHEAWTNVCRRLLPSPMARKDATVLAARSGLLRRLVDASEGASQDDFRFAALQVLRPLPNHRLMVEELTTELHLVRGTRRPTHHEPAEDDATDRNPHEERRATEPLSYDRMAVFDSVNRQKDAIVNHMRQGRFDLVEKYVDELIHHQLPLDHRGEKTSMSLCALATEAKTMGLFELQLDLAKRAVSVRHQDGWAWAQVGDASLILDRFNEAFTAFRNATEFGSDLLGLVGRARGLLKMGKHQQALAAYEDVIREYPSEVVAKNGRAEVLKSMGKLEEALVAYGDVIREYPTNIFAKTGRAEVLKSMGKLEEALVAYDDVIREYPSDVVAKNGRAEVLKSMGRLEEALATYDDVIWEHPVNVVAKNGRAEGLKSMGKLKEALAAYGDVIREHPTNIFAKTGRAEVLKSMGRLEEALATYDDVIRDHPSGVVAKNGRAEVLKSMGKLEEALATYDDVIRDHPSDVVAKTGRAEVLKSKGRLEQALVAYNDVIREYPSDVVAKTGRAGVFKSMGKLEEALGAYDDVIRDHPSYVVARTGRAEVLKSMGKLEEALGAYDDVIRDHPSYAVAKNGRAEVFKSMGELEEAQTAYGDVIRDHPANLFAKDGLAEVLKSMAKLEEALGAYDDVIREYPSDVVARNGRAEVLKSMGKLEEALGAYDDVIQQFPANLFAKTGRAEVLKSMGKLEEALGAYDDVIREYPSNVVAKTGRAGVLRSMGKVEEALVAYDDVIQEHAADVFAKNGRAVALCTLGRYEEILALPIISPRTRQEWIALHIQGMAMIRARRIDEALEIFLRGRDENPFVADRDVFKSGLALARVHQRAYEAALAILENVHEVNTGRVISFLRGHSAGALGDASGAARFLSATGPPRNERERELKAELERRFVRREAPLHDEEWLINHEIDCVLLAA